MPLRILKYPFRYSLLSVSSPRFNGVHFGSSWNNLIAFVYYDVVSTVSNPRIRPQLTYILLISSKPMINPRWHNHQIPLLQPNPHPLVPLTPHIKVSSPIQDIPDLLILVQVLVEEILDLLLVVGQSGWGDFDGVAVLVVSVFGDAVDGG